jgi:4'-phosphopantetheinyl transferase
MVTIYYTRVLRELDPRTFELLHQDFPETIKKRITSFRCWKDSHAALFGKVLLNHAISELGLVELSLSNMLIDKFHRPYFNYPFNFNISHSGEFVICAASLEESLGVDIEYKDQNVSIDDFADIFNQRQWDEIQQSVNPVEPFFNYWTLKEAVIKADGRGLGVALKEIDIQNGKSEVNGKTWYLQNLNFGNLHAAHLATSSPTIPVLKEVYIYNKSNS